MQTIKFGTDGWRGVIADDLTFGNIRLVAQAAADYVNARPERKHLVVGYDTRFAGADFARAIAEVLAGNGISVFLSQEATPTPSVSLAVLEQKAAGGVMVTASHNPPRYSGFKFKGPFGGAASPAMTGEIEKLLGRNPVRTMSLEEAERAGLLTKGDLKAAHRRKAAAYVDLARIRKASHRIVVDTMHGAGFGYMPTLFKGSRCRIETMHENPDPLFGGIAPEPKAANLKELMREVKRRRAGLGFATDGDADRIGLVDDCGHFVGAQQILSLLCLHLARRRKMSGGVVCTSGTTLQLSRIATSLGLPIYHTPIGFKYVTELMLTKDILIGGEESGGVGVKGYFPERDGLVACLLVLEMMTLNGQSLSGLIRDMEKEFGRFVYDRSDAVLPIDQRDRMLAKLVQQGPARLAGLKVTRRDTTDGIKFFLDPPGWLLLRGSGTEPILRIYAESGSKSDTAALLEAGRQMARSSS
jgi:alpha-D-glucose phosphate-specific phosphoglucomutase